MPVVPNVFHSESYFILLSNASTTRVASSRVVLESGAYWMRSNRKGLLATTVKSLGVFLATIFFDEQISTLFGST